MSDAMTHEIRLRMAKAMESSGETETVQRKMCQNDVNAAGLGQVHEQICAEAIRLAQSGLGPTPLLQSLCQLELWQLCPMAAEAHHHATVEAMREQMMTDLAQRCPMVAIKKTLYVAPVGELDLEALQCIGDRILGFITHHKIKKMVFMRHGMTVTDETYADWMHLLQEDLSASKIKLQVLALE